MQTTLLHQYKLVLGARAALLTYCETLQPKHILEQVPQFNNSSIKSLMVHTANTYLYWLVDVGQQKPPHYFKEEDIIDLPGLKQMYQQVDITINDFLMTCKDNCENQSEYLLPGKNVCLTLTPLQIFTHGITHEFHHKGQVLIMSRLLGYIPADTDVIRFVG